MTKIFQMLDPDILVRLMWGDLEASFADESAPLHAGNGFEAFRQVGEAVLLVRFPEPVAGGLREVGETFLALQQRPLGAFELGDVENGILNRRRAIPVDHAHQILQCDDGTILAHRVVLVGIRGRLSAHPVVAELAQALELVGRDQPLHGADGKQLVDGVVAVDAGIGLVDEQRRPVPVNEYALDGSFDQVAELLFALLERVHAAAALGDVHHRALDCRRPHPVDHPHRVFQRDDRTVLAHRVDLVARRHRVPAHPRFDIVLAALPLVWRDERLDGLEAQNLFWSVVAEDLRVRLVHEQGFRIAVDEYPLD